MLTVALAAMLVAGGAVLPPPVQPAVVRVPDEPGAFVLPDARPTLQAVAADLDADGAPELVRLLAGEQETIWIELWREVDDGWALVAPPTLAVPGEAGQAELAYARRPVRLLVRRADGGDRVTLVRQPDFTEPGDPRECCLLLDDIVLDGGALHLDRVADPGANADAVHVIDLDGDGTDELLATFSLAPLDDASTPTEARVFRWADDRFAPPTTTELPVGSGSSPFILGDSDGVSGDEAAMISSSALSVLFRIGLGADDMLVAEDSGLIVSDALAVPLGDRRGLAVVGPTIGLAVLSWPRGEPVGAALASLPIVDARLIGVIEVGGEPRLLTHRPDADALHPLALPGLTQLLRGPIGLSRAAGSLARGSITPFEGLLPGGGPDGERAAIVSGRLLPAPLLGDRAAEVGALPAGRPAGLVGRERAWLAIHHGASEVDPAGGRLEPPAFHPGSAVTIAPLVLFLAPEEDGGGYEPETVGGVVLDGGVTGTSDDGLVAEVHAPPGSRVYLSSPDAIAAAPRVVGDAATLDVVVEPPTDATTEATGRVTMTVATPAGHAYVSSWQLRLVEGPPSLTARTETQLGSSRVTIAGRTAPYAQIDVAGTAAAVDEDGRFSTSVDLPPWPTAVTVTASDNFGNEASLVLSGIGIFDYRALPWVPIAIVLVAAAGVALILRVPQPRASFRAVGDEADLEELDPADRL